MAYSVTDQQIYNDCMYTLLESADSGASNPASGLWTTAEVMARLNYRLYEYNKQTGIIVNDGAVQQIAVATGGGSHANPGNPNALIYLAAIVDWTGPTSGGGGIIPTTRDVNTPTDMIDMIQVNYDQTGTGSWVMVPRGSVYEADLFQGDDTTAASQPVLWTLEDSPAQSLSLFPPVASTFNLRYYYVQRPPTLPAAPVGTTINIPDDLTPFIKYGALADCFGKSGETYDPQRQQLCQQIFELGVDLGKAWVAGQS